MADRPYTEDFETFWRAYPKRAGNPKHPAWLEWERLRKAGVLPDLPALLGALSAYRAHAKKEKIEGTALIAHAKTWLHQRRWGDWAPADQPAAPVMAWWDTDVRWAAFAQAIGVHHMRTWFAQITVTPLGIMAKTRFERDKIEELFGDRLRSWFGDGFVISLPPPNVVQFKV